MTRLRSLIKEVLSTPPKKKDCNCGCGGCGKKAPVLTESKTKTTISEGLQYHIDKKVPLHESVYRIGSEKHFALINEARALWVRELINVSEDDQAILETHLGNFGMYEGEEVPLDLPMVHEGTFQGNEIAIYGGEDGETYIEKRGTGYYGYNNSFDFTAKDKAELKQMLSMWGYYPIAGSINEDIYDKFLDDPQSPKGRAKAIISKFIKQYGEDASGMAVDRFAKQNNLKPEEKYILKYITKNDTSISSKPGGPDFSALNEVHKLLRNNDKYLGYSASEQIYYVIDSKTGKEVKHTENAMAQLYGSDWKEQIDEAKKKSKSKKKDPPLNKPKRGGPKAYYVYVRDPKTKKIKKVSFGSGGLRAKIKNKEARNAFAARHNCKNKKDRTKAGYWSCNLPRYADQLGLGSKMNTFW